ncbi:MAG TPA: maleylpyruvate isomerase family mycothiol-dependent enzyme [Egibacteraceae bacterium]|nr:maleylpyruvate isomerase family mycothiol-dependent enzyme [Egibacteraceae bacterium]
MTAQTLRDPADIPRITFETDAGEVALAVYDQLLTLLQTLAPPEWDARTDCPAWTVADMVGHLLGAARANASLRETIRQQVWALRHKGEFDGNDLDAMNALQVREHSALSAHERIETLRALAPKAVAGRRRFPRLLRRVQVPLATTGSAAAGMPQSLRLGHLMDVIYTRDVWLHRVDIARATGRSLALDPVVDGRVVEDVTAEWAQRHGQPFTLLLTGPAGGAFRRGTGGPTIEMDAVEFCRTLSGRVPGEGLLQVGVLF